MGTCWYPGMAAGVRQRQPLRECSAAGPPSGGEQFCHTPGPHPGGLWVPNAPSARADHHHSLVGQELPRSSRGQGSWDRKSFPLLPGCPAAGASDRWLGQASSSPPPWLGRSRAEQRDGKARGSAALRVPWAAGRVAIPRGCLESSGASPHRELASPGTGEAGREGLAGQPSSPRAPTFGLGASLVGRLLLPAALARRLQGALRAARI